MREIEEREVKSFYKLTKKAIYKKTNFLKKNKLFFFREKKIKLKTYGRKSNLIFFILSVLLN